MRTSLLAVALMCIVARACTAQHPARLFMSETAYDPLPSPDGKHVAFVLTGRDRYPGLSGLGRFNLRSLIGFADPDGTTIRNTSADGFLAGWLPDSQAVVSYRDWRFGLVGLDEQKKDGGSIPEAKKAARPERAERVAYDSTRRTFVWITQVKGTSSLQTPTGMLGTVKGLLPLSALIIPSPDGRYLAVGGPSPYAYESHDLWVFDTRKRTWKDFGPLAVHPDPNWDYIKPSWNPWFADSNRLAFFSGRKLCIASVDGRTRRTLLEAKNAGLAVPAKDGRTIAYATFSKRARDKQPDHAFWGGSTLWVVSTLGGTPKQVTTPSTDETFSLQWLDPSTLIFDRIGESLFSEDARIWTARIDGN